MKLLALLFVLAAIVAAVAPSAWAGMYDGAHPVRTP